MSVHLARGSASCCFPRRSDWRSRTRTCPPGASACSGSISRRGGEPPFGRSEPGPSDALRCGLLLRACRCPHRLKERLGLAVQPLDDRKLLVTDRAEPPDLLARSPAGASDATRARP